ncbi:MAG: hypothetical protein M1830_004630 [Pleopsidium flavum]|nr:MAG: hypothetical protein M1830_004630 [Pleopsidium flavum]
MAMRCKRRRFVVLSSDSEGSDYDNNPDISTTTALRPVSQAPMPQLMRRRGGPLFQLPPSGVVVLSSDSEEDGGLSLKDQDALAGTYDKAEYKKAHNLGLVARSGKRKRTTAGLGNAMQTGSRNKCSPQGRLWFDYVASKSKIIGRNP